MSMLGCTPLWMCGDDRSGESEGHLRSLQEAAEESGASHFRGREKRQVASIVVKFCIYVTGGTNLANAGSRLGPSLFASTSDYCEMMNERKGTLTWQGRLSKATHAVKENRLTTVSKQGAEVF